MKENPCVKALMKYNILDKEMGNYFISEKFFLYG